MKSINKPNLTNRGTLETLIFLFKEEEMNVLLTFKNLYIDLIKACGFSFASSIKRTQTLSFPNFLKSQEIFL